jgi:diketogulonate reductase-like aldo/keto reductase
MQWLSLRGVRIPRLLYGTAWKEDETRPLVELALARGFRGIDTANQRKHYHEAGVGEAVRQALAGGLRREDLFLQTKFTFAAGQDHRLPYDPAAPYADQVAQSFASSLQHLGTDKLDAYVLHGPSQRPGLGQADLEVWSAMEQLHERGSVGLLGVSNVSLAQLEELCGRVRVPPALVQNRCYARTGWDADVRAFCAARGMVYEGFSLLTANRDVWNHHVVAERARALGRTPAQVILRFALQLGMVPLTGTTDGAHMAQDLEIFDVTLDEDAMTRLGALGR